MISSAAMRHMQAAAARDPDREACGLLLGDGAAIVVATDAQNIAADARRHFEIDPAALFVALRNERGGGLRLMGYWHTHPKGSALPSITDARMADPDGRLWIILGGDDVSAWRSVPGGTLHGRFDSVELVVQSDQP